MRPADALLTALFSMLYPSSRSLSRVMLKLMCIPFPQSSLIGLGIKLACTPWISATDFTADLKLRNVSAALSADDALKSISCCPQPLS